MNHLKTDWNKNPNFIFLRDHVDILFLIIKKGTAQLRNAFTVFFFDSKSFL